MCVVGGEGGGGVTEAVQHGGRTVGFADYYEKGSGHGSHPSKGRRSIQPRVRERPKLNKCRGEGKNDP